MYPVTDSIIGIEKSYNNNAGANFTGFDLYLCGVVGFAITGLLIWVTEYYTGGAPVKKIAKGGETGSATIMITGLATGMQSVAIPVFTIVCIILLMGVRR